MKSYLISTLTLLLLVSTLSVSTFLNSSFAKGENVYAVAIFKPNASYSEILSKIHNADGYILNEGASDLIILSVSQEEKYKENLYKQGALLVFKTPQIPMCFKS